MDDLTIADLVRLVDEIKYRQPVRGFVCTPETFARLRAFGARQADEFERRTGKRYDALPSAIPTLTGIPVRVERDPHPEPGEALLELPPAGGS